MDKKRLSALIEEYESGRVGYRTLARKYKVSLGFISKMIRKKRNQQQPVKPKPKVKEEALPDDPELLKEEIRKLKLKIELQDIIIDISSKELGVDLRKKRGARQS
jgi:intein/homing endonuclease